MKAKPVVIIPDLDRFRVVVESLSEEFDLMDIALAATKLAHEALVGAEDEEENIPEAAARPDRFDRNDRSSRDPAARRPGKPVGAPRGKAQSRGGGEGMTRVFIGAGRDAGVRPQDLVGAIANEAGISGKDIGAIEISDRFSLVEVPEGVADGVIAALRGSTIKGKKPVVRRERFTN